MKLCGGIRAQRDRVSQPETHSPRTTPILALLDADVGEGALRQYADSVSPQL